MATLLASPISTLPCYHGRCLITIGLVSGITYAIAALDTILTIFNDTTVSTGWAQAGYSLATFAIGFLLFYIITDSPLGATTEEE